MDGKKKRNRKKKGKNTGDAVTNADEAVPQSHNDDLAPKENYSGADADDAVSSVGEGTQYQNHKQTPHAKQNVANADETISSSVGEVIPCDENHEPTRTQENHKVSNTVYADQRSIGMSDSTVELDKDRFYEAKLVSSSVKGNYLCNSSLIYFHCEHPLIVHTYHVTIPVKKNVVISAILLLDTCSFISEHYMDFSICTSSSAFAHLILCAVRPCKYAHCLRRINYTIQ